MTTVGWNGLDIRRGGSCRAIELILYSFDLEILNRVLVLPEVGYNSVSGRFGLPVTAQNCSLLSSHHKLSRHCRLVLQGNSAKGWFSLFGDIQD